MVINFKQRCQTKLEKIERQPLVAYRYCFRQLECPNWSLHQKTVMSAQGLRDSWLESTWSDAVHRASSKVAELMELWKAFQIQQPLNNLHGDLSHFWALEWWLLPIQKSWGQEIQILHRIKNGSCKINTFKLLTTRQRTRYWTDSRVESPVNFIAQLRMLR
jgi:hypothetical protein